MQENQHHKITGELEAQRKDFTLCVKKLVDIYYPNAEKVVLVMGHLDTHSIASLYTAFRWKRPNESLTDWRFTILRNCIIHQIRNSTRYVSYKDLKALVADLKAVYAAVDEPSALDALEVFAEHWDKKYPKISNSWRDNWANLSTYFKYPQEVRRLIYTTNAIEGFNRQLRKVTKSKSVFPTDDSLLKMLYLAMMDITRKWTGRRQDWSVIHAQLAVYFADRMPD